MPIPEQNCRFLNSRHVNYQSRTLLRAFTAQGTILTEYPGGKKPAKAAIVILDGKKKDHYRSPCLLLRGY